MAAAPAKPQRPGTSPAASKPTRPAQKPSTAPVRPKPPSTASEQAAEPKKMRKIPGKPTTRPAKKEKLVDKSAESQPSKPKVQSVDLLGSLNESPMQENEPQSDHHQIEIPAVDLLANSSSQAGPSNLDLLMGTADVDVGFRGD